MTKPILRVAINGFGRIGRNVLRAFLEYEHEFLSIQIVAINDIASADSLVHLLNYDSTHGRLSAINAHAYLDGDELCIKKADKLWRITLCNHADPTLLPWQALAIDVVLECTGVFRGYDEASRHLHAGAKQVIIGAAPFDKVDACIVLGVNDKQLTRALPIISSVSCTTQALVPLLWLLDEAFGIDSALLTEIHAVTADQRVLDTPHRDLRRARASGYNIIPTTSSSIQATLQVLPNLQGKLAGYSVRVPTINVAMIDVTLTLQRTPSLAGIRQTLQEASSGSLHGIMAYTEAPLVSSDFVHDRRSLIIDGEMLMLANGQFKVVAWYDNEWGYANRLLALCVALADCTH